MQSTLTVRGQTVIPAPIRRRWGLKPHTKLVWVDDEEGIAVFPVLANPARGLRGLTKGERLHAALLRERRLDQTRERS